MQVDEMIVLASSNFAFNEGGTRQITAKNGRVLTLDQPLNYLHYGAPSAETSNDLVVRLDTVERDFSDGTVYNANL